MAYGILMAWIGGHQVSSFNLWIRIEAESDCFCVHLRGRLLFFFGGGRAGQCSWFPALGKVVDLVEEAGPNCAGVPFRKGKKEGLLFVWPLEFPSSFLLLLVRPLLLVAMHLFLVAFCLAFGMHLEVPT